MEKIINSLKSYFKAHGMTQAQVAERLETTQQAVGLYLTGKQSFSAKSAKKWSDVFGFNMSFLTTGEGILKGDPDPSAPATATLPVVPVSAMGGPLTGFAVDGVTERECERMTCPVDGADMIVTMTGESMAPQFPNGSKLVVKRIQEAAFIEWGRPYLLDTCNGAVVKVVTPASDESAIECRSVNPDPIYAPFLIRKKDIFGIYRILLCMALN